MESGIRLATVVRDRNGRILSDYERLGHSYLRQFNQLVYVMMNNGANENVIQTNGVGAPGNAQGANFRIVAGAGNIALGTVVGTDNTPVTINDFAMGTLIAQGLGAGQLNYQACTLANPIVAAGVTSFVVSRQMINNSGGVITVQEIGIYMGFSVAPVKYCCGIRDIASEAIPNGGTLSTTYTLRVVL